MDKKVNLKAGDKYIWDITQTECDYIYKNLHMDNYIYAGYTIVQSGSYPLNKCIEPIYANIPCYLHSIFKKYCDLSVNLNAHQTRKKRILSSCLALELYQQLGEVQPDDIETVIQSLCALAYIPLVADKNDNLLLWSNPVVRPEDECSKSVFSQLLTGCSLETILKNKYLSGLIWESHHIHFLHIFTSYATKSIVAMIENNHCRHEIEKAYNNMEKCILEYEYKNDIGNKNKFSNNIKHHAQIRFRNTLYLYGGNFFERNSHYEKAFQWYTKDIFSFDILDTAEFFLTLLKTCERFLCAYRVAPLVGEDTDIIIEILNRLLESSFKAAAKYAESLTQYLKQHPGTDLTGISIKVKPEDVLPGFENGYLFGGEAANEVFLFALLYNKIVFNQDYKNVDYMKFLKLK